MGLASTNAACICIQLDSKHAVDVWSKNLTGTFSEASTSNELSKPTKNKHGSFKLVKGLLWAFQYGSA